MIRNHPKATIGRLFDRGLKGYRPSRHALSAHPLAAGLLLALMGGAASSAWARETTTAVRPASPDVAMTAPAFNPSAYRDDSFLLQHMAEFQAKRERARLHAAATASGLAAQVRPVTSCGDASDDPGTLRNVIAAAASGDTIDLRSLTCSTITLQPGQIAVSVADLTIEGPGQDVMAIDGNHVMRPFYHYGAGSFTLRDVTIANGRHVNASFSGAYDGGCILSLGKVVLDHATVTGCEVGSLHAYGGAIFAYEVDISSSIVSNSSAFSDQGTASGGAIFVKGSGFGYGVTMRNSSITGNQARGILPAGGGVMTLLAGIQATSSDVSGNTAYSPAVIGTRTSGAVGGGLLMWTHVVGYDFYGVALSLLDSTVSGNAARSANSYAIGAGAYLNGPGWTSLVRSTVAGNTVAAKTLGIGSGFAALGSRASAGDYSTYHYISNSTISGNVISGELAGSNDTAYAAGIQITGGTLIIDQSTISGNRVETGAATSAVGGISARKLMLTNSTLAFNSALGSTGGLQVARTWYFPDTLIQNSIIAGNVAPVDADVGVGGTASMGSVMVQGSHDLISAAIDNPALVFPADTIVGDARLLPLALNGGATQTHALGPDSPAIDTGLPSSAAYDQRGFPFVRTFGTATDIGAFEQQSPLLAIEVGFAPIMIDAGGRSTLTLTLINTYPLSATLASPLVDLFPAGLVVASPPNASATCNGPGAFFAEAGANSIEVDSATQVPIGSCTVSVDVTAATSGAYTDTIPAGGLSTNLGINGEAASATLTVNSANEIFTNGFEWD